MPEPAEIREDNKNRVQEIIEQLQIKDFDAAATLIPQMLADNNLVLDDSAYTCAAEDTYEKNGVNRYLIYDHPDKENPFSIWAFSFAPHQKTCIHDHKFECSVTVLSEHPVSEKFYLPTGKISPTKMPLAKRISSVDRYRFYSSCDTLDRPEAHQIKNTKHLGDGVGITLHIYRMEARVIKDGVESDNRNLNIIYQKGK